MSQLIAVCATTRWTREHIMGMRVLPRDEIPLVGPQDVAPIIPGLDLWDLWPVQDRDGQTVTFHNETLWAMLSAPRFDNPAARHDFARIRLVGRCDGCWIDYGNLLPDGHAPGTREWAGSTVYDEDTRQLTLFFTATGRLSKPDSFEQRQFETHGQLVWANGRARVEGWSPPSELYRPDNIDYVDTRKSAGGPGLLKGFRDPAYFRDPVNGSEYLVFTGSDASSEASHNGVIGLAQGRRAGWRLRQPILNASGLTNELERPHLLYRDGRYYLFWSTQRSVFAPDLPGGPTGLYGAVAEDVGGPYRFLNGSGLIAACPKVEPFQTYSWLVTDSLDVVSFVDFWGLEGHRPDTHPGGLRGQFGGVPAPVFRITLNGESAHITQE